MFATPKISFDLMHRLVGRWRAPRPPKEFAGQDTLAVKPSRSVAGQLMLKSLLRLPRCWTDKRHLVMEGATHKICLYLFCQFSCLLLGGCRTIPTDTAAAQPVSHTDAVHVAASPVAVAPGRSLPTESAVRKLPVRLPPVDAPRTVESDPATIQLVAHQQFVDDHQSEESNGVEVVPSPLPVEGEQESCLALADFEAMALRQNPAVAEAAARVSALQGKYVQVGLPPNPIAGYTASEVGNDGRAGQQGAFIGQQFITGGKLRLNRAVASREVRQAQQQWSVIQQRVLTDVRIAFYEVLIAQQRLAVTENLFAVGQQGVQAVEALLKAQEASGTELLQSKIEANTAQIFIENARAARFGAWLRLVTIVGAPEMPLADVAGDAASNLPTIDFDSSLEQILATSPQLAAAYTNIDQARWAIQRAQAEVVPDVNVQGSVQYDYGSEFAIAGVQVGLPIPLINRNQGGIQQARAELTAAQQAAGRIELALRKRLAEVYQRYLMARQQVDRYAADILPQADETLRLTTEGYQAGEFNYLQLLTVQRTYFQTNLSYLDALGRMWAASREIEGLLLSGSLETGS